MTDILRIDHVTKSYDKFQLKDISFSVPSGCIMGLIGENGAGKTTVMKAILQLIAPEEGKVFLFGQEFDGRDRAVLEQVGVVLDRCYFYPDLTGKNVNHMMKQIYQSWEEDRFYSYLEQFSIDPGKSIRKYSRGMETKLSLACALSHQSRLLILDEPAGGLDPAAREELLDLFWNFIQEENHSILLSSHIVTDLEKICDYLTYIHKGKLIFSEEKDRLMEAYGVVKGTRSQLAVLEPSAVVSIRENAFGAEALVQREWIPEGMIWEPADMETIMIFHGKC